MVGAFYSRSTTEVTPRSPPSASATKPQHMSSIAKLRSPADAGWFPTIPESERQLGCSAAATAV